MKIIRDGKEFELTFSEMIQANEEYKLDCMVEDVKNQYAQGEYDVELTDEQIEEVASNALRAVSKNDSYFEAYWMSVQYALDDYVNGLPVEMEGRRVMKIQNKYEKLFEDFLETIEFGLLKNKNDYYIDTEGEEHIGQWSLVDLQGANLGDIQIDRFRNATQVIDRLDIYIDDYLLDDLEKELEEYNVDLEDREVPWGAMDWVSLRNDTEFYNKNKKYFDDHSFEFDILDMIAYHTDEINLENVYYESEEE